MPSPFPGMDPYLEHPNLWPDVHSTLINAMRALLKPSLPPGYIARLDLQVTIDRITDPDDAKDLVPDVAILRKRSAPQPAGGMPLAATPAPLRVANVLYVPFRQRSIEIRRSADKRLVTIIELLSPVNKRSGDDRYQQKRNEMIDSGVHLLEIDLLRQGRRVQLMYPLPAAPYFVLLSRADESPWCDVWPLPLAEPLPVIPVPLLDGDPDVPLNLGAALTRAYDEAGYDDMVDYTADPVPPLTDEDATWAAALLREKGLRS